MVDKETQRFIKEGLIAIDREYRNDVPHILQVPVYYLPLEADSIDHVGKIVSTMHSLPEIPWPAEDCIICTEDHISHFLDSPVKLFLFIVRLGEKTKRYNLVPKSDEIGHIEPLDFFTLFLDPNDRNAMRILRREISMIHNDGAVLAPCSEEFMQRQLNKFPSMTSEQEETLRSYWRATSAGYYEKGVWLAHENGVRQPQMGLASDVLGYLSNIVAPCNYFVRSTFVQGFGSSRVQRQTRNKEILSVIGYNRLYQIVNQEPREHTEREPHSRRGHLRYHWLKGKPPVDRFTLPPFTEMRLRIALAHKVPRTYIVPTWVGPRYYHDGNVIHEILTDPIALS